VASGLASLRDAIGLRRDGNPVVFVAALLDHRLMAVNPPGYQSDGGPIRHHPGGIPAM